MSYDSTILAHASITGYWPLSESVGASTAVDGTSGGHNGTASSVTFGVTGIPGDTGSTAASFAGAGSILVGTAGVINPSTGSYECWFKTSSTAGPLAAMSGNNMVLELQTGHLQPTFNPTGQRSLTGTSVADSAWHYYVATFDSGAGTADIWLDNVKVLSAATYATNTYGPFAIGCYNNGSSLFYQFIGSLAKIATYSARLLDAEIADHYTRGIGIQTIAYTDSHIFYAPACWRDTGTARLTNTPGSYVRTAVTGTTILTAHFDTSALTGASVPSGSYPFVAYSIGEGPLTRVQLTSSGSVPLATGLTSGNTYDVFLALDSVDNAYDRWTTPVEALAFNNLGVDAAGSMVSPTLRTKRALFLGDSITEGANVITSGTYPQDMFATLAYPYFVGPALDCEFGVVAFSGQGFTRTALTNVPVFEDSGTRTWDKYSNGQSRLSSGLLPTFDYVFLNMGTNDGAASVSGATITTDTQAYLTAMRTAAGSSTWLFVIIPFGYWERSAILAGVAAYQAAAPSDLKVASLDIGQIPGFSTVGGVASLYGSDGIHGNQYGHAYVGALLAAAAQAVLGGGGAGPVTPPSRTRYTTAGTHVVKATPGVLHGVACSAATPGSVSVYDNASAASGAVVLAENPPPNGVPVALKGTIPMANGIVIVTPDAGPYDVEWK